jgi:hypothetical protein
MARALAALLAALGLLTALGDAGARAGTPVPGQQQLLARLLRGLAGSDIARATIGPPPLSFGRPRGTVWLYVEIRGRASNGAGHVRGHWQASILTGLLRDLSVARRFPRIDGQSLVEVLPDGSKKRVGASSIDLEPQTIVSTSEAGLRAVLARAAASASVPVTLVKVTFRRPLGRLAPELLVRTGEPRRFAADGPARVRELFGGITGWGGRPRAEGAYVEVYDTRGRFVLASGYSVRTGLGVGRVAGAPGARPP